MSTDLGITIKVDASSAKPAIQDVGRELAKVEAQGPAVSAALSKGMREGSSAAEKLKQSTAAAITPFDGLTAALKREQDMLERIHGPLNNYTKDLQTLDSLLDRNRISTEEYAAQVSKLNKALGETPEPRAHEREHGGGFEGSFAGAIGGRFGEVGSLAGGIASSGAIESAGLVGLGAELINISDEYTKMSNAARRVGDSTRTVNENVHAQLDLAGRLHSSFEETVELTDVIKDRTADLNLTNAERLRLTEALGQAAEIEGKSVGSAAGSMERLAFMLDEGLPAGRALKQIFMEFPPIQEAMEEHFHKSGSDLIAMGNAGKIGMDEFTAALINSKKIAEEHAQLGETFGQKWHHAMDEVKVATGEALDSVTRGIDAEAMIKRLATSTHDFADAWGSFQKGIRAGDTQVFLGQIHDLNKEFDHLANVGMKSLDENVAKLLHGGFAELFGDKWGKNINDYKTATHALTDEQQEEKRVMDELYGAGEKLNHRLEALHEMVGKGALPWYEYTKATREAIAAAREAQGLGLTSATGGIGIPAPGDNSALDLGMSEEAKRQAGREYEENHVSLSAGDEALTRYEDAMKRYEEVSKKTFSTIQEAIAPIGQGLLDAAHTGEISFEKMGESVLETIESMIMKELELKLAAMLTDEIVEKPKLATGGDFGSFGGALSALAGLGGAATGGYFEIPHAANGFAGIVPNRSGQDTHLAMFHVRQGEDVTIRTPEQRAAATQGGFGAQLLQPIVQVSMPDQRGALMANLHGGDGRTMVMKHIGENRGAIRAMLGLK